MTWVPDFEEYTKLVLFLEQGQTISAIKYVREVSPMDLRDSKDWVESFIDSHYLPFWGDEDG